MKLHQRNTIQNYYSDTKQILPSYETKASFLRKDKNSLDQKDQASTKKFDFVSRINTRRTLLVGEGNFSFTLSLLKKSKGYTNILTSCFEEASSLSNLAK